MKLSMVNGYAIDIGGTKTAAAKILSGVVLKRIIESTNRDLTLEGQLDAIENLLKRLGWYRNDEVIGLSVTGRVSASGHWSAVNLDTMTEVNEAPLADIARERLGNVIVSNDASATTLAEFNFGAGQGANNFAYITVSTGIGGGLVVNGKLIQSKRGLAGHLGFSTVRDATAECGCGRTGTSESISSGTAIARMAAEEGYPDLTAKDVFDAFYAGEDWADKIIDRSARSLAELCANLTALIDPDCIAIGGSVGLADGYIERVKAFVGKEPVLFQRPIVKASMGSDGPLLGALIQGKTS